MKEKVLVSSPSPRQSDSGAGPRRSGSTALSKQNKIVRDKIIHISTPVHKKLKIFCATLDIDLGRTAEKAITDYITKNS